MFLFTLAFIALNVLFASMFASMGIFWAFWITFVPLALLELEIVTFFRDPERDIPADPDVLVSPADGTVTNIEEVDEPEFGKAARISIFLSVFNVHVNRCPFGGEVVDVRYFPGAFLDARNRQPMRNEQLWIDMIEPNSKRPIRVKQISGAIAGASSAGSSRAMCSQRRTHRHDQARVTHRCADSSGRHREICVKIGDTVAGGATVLLKSRKPRDEVLRFPRVRSTLRPFARTDRIGGGIQRQAERAGTHVFRDVLSWSFPTIPIFGIMVHIHLILPIFFVGMIGRVALARTGAARNLRRGPGRMPLR